MLEPPGISDDDIVERVRERWAIAATSAVFLPVGNDSRAWAYRIEAELGRVFLKVRAGPADPASLSVPRFLAERGIGQMVPPIPTVDGAPSDPGDPFTFVVMPFVDGVNGGEAGLTEAMQRELGSVLCRMHDTAPDRALAAIIRHETFGAVAAGDVRRAAAVVETGVFDDEHQRAAAAFWRGRGAEIARIVERAVDLGARARGRPHRLAICHADIHAWNVLVQPDGGFVIVDWDETLLAPRERDLMFVEGGVGGLDNDADAFFAGYGEVRIDPVVMSYYRYAWVVEEIADYGRRAFLDPSFGDATRADAVASLAGIFDPGEVVEAAYRSDR